MREEPKPYQIYQHFKGNLYQILTLAQDSETCDTVVVYQALYSPYKVWVRDLSMFMSEVDKKKYPEVTAVYRFTQKELKEEQEPRVEQDRKPESAEMKTTESIDDDYDEVVLDPLVMEFLDSDTYDDKLNIIRALQHRITDEMINTMAIAMDVEVGEGKIEDRYAELQNCLLTLKKYECSRVR
ncbi:MAG: DUF1653 domain-containing protein [Lachnospiraceae bacterium]